MQIEINKQQALKLWKTHNVIMKNLNIGKISEKENCTNNDIINNSNLNFYIELNKKEKEEAYQLINKRLNFALISSLFFCFGFMNFAIYTNKFLYYNLYWFCFLMIVSGLFLTKAINDQDINRFIDSIGKPC